MGRSIRLTIDEEMVTVETGTRSTGGVSILNHSAGHYPNREEGLSQIISRFGTKEFTKGFCGLCSGQGIVRERFRRRIQWGVRRT